MEFSRHQSLCVGRGFIASAALASLFLLGSCASVINVSTASPAPAARAQAAPPADDDDFSLLITQLRQDLSRTKAREVARPGSGKATPQTASATAARDRSFADRAKSLFSNLDSQRLVMPVIGVRALDLDDTWHASRDGGRRKHKGIDIFAPKGTDLVAVADGIISYIGVQPKGGNCLWLTTENGASYYYAHLDRWAPGLYEGMSVASGDLLGYVGNTGNAISTPPHLHFAVNTDDEMVNPYPILTKAVLVRTANAAPHFGGGFGTK